MRRVLRLAGTLLLVLGSSGLVLVAFAPLLEPLSARLPSAAVAPTSWLATPTVTRTLERPVVGSQPTPTQVADTLVAVPTSTAVPERLPTPRPTREPIPTPVPWLPITGLQVHSIKLETEVVLSHLVEQNGVTTWEVPAFKAGHAEGTAGAGGAGNAVVIGHLTSLRSGDVFRDLHGVQVGDTVQVFSNDQRFDYRVVEVFSVRPEEISVVDPTPTPSLTLITCTGQWLPLERDYAERLVVRAELLPLAAD